MNNIFEGIFEDLANKVAARQELAEQARLRTFNLFLRAAGKDVAEFWKNATLKTAPDLLICDEELDELEDIRASGLFTVQTSPWFKRTGNAIITWKSLYKIGDESYTLSTNPSLSEQGKPKSKLIILK